MPVRIWGLVAVQVSEVLEDRVTAASDDRSVFVYIEGLPEMKVRQTFFYGRYGQFRKIVVFLLKSNAYV